jgi:hypothetical protein
MAHSNSGTAASASGNKPQPDLSFHYLPKPDDDALMQKERKTYKSIFMENPFVPIGKRSLVLDVNLLFYFLSIRLIWGKINVYSYYLLFVFIITIFIVYFVLFMFARFLGLTVTLGALGYGVYQLKTGDRKMSQRMMRLRVGAQAFTVIALLVGAEFAARKVTDSSASAS